MQKLIHSMVSGLKRSVSLRVRVRVLASVVPKRLWFRTAVALSKVQGRVSCAGSPEKAGWAQVMALDWWLYELTLRGEYPLPCRVIGMEVLREAVQRGDGTLMCGTHVPLMRMVMRVPLDHGVAISFVVAGGQQVTAEGRWLPAGWPKGSPAIAQGPESLMRMRGHLRRGEVGAIMVDREVGGPFYPNGMRLAGRMGARVVFATSELGDDGVPTVTYWEAPHPVPDTEEKVSENLAVLEAQRARILGALRYVPEAAAEIEQAGLLETRA